MKAKKIFEYQNFKQGSDPYNILKIGAKYKPYKTGDKFKILVDLIWQQSTVKEYNLPGQWIIETSTIETSTNEEYSKIYEGDIFIFNGIFGGTELYKDWIKMTSKRLSGGGYLVFDPKWLQENDGILVKRI